MKNQRTCGQGLAERSVLPAKMGGVISALAEILELHMKALDLTDESAKKERDAYRQLTREHQKVAAQLQATAQRMAGYRDLPMGRHDQKAMSSPQVREAFEKFVTREQELEALLQNQIDEDRRMLIEMVGGGRGRG
jgi:uncharacterized protein (DUF3084 family)